MAGDIDRERCLQGISIPAQYGFLGNFTSRSEELVARPGLNNEFCWGPSLFDEEAMKGRFHRYDDRYENIVMMIWSSVKNPVEKPGWESRCCSLSQWGCVDAQNRLN